MDIRTLVLQLGDAETGVRVAARDTLVAAGPAAVAEIVAELLDEHSPVIPIVAAFVLRSYGDAAVGPVTEALAAAPNRKVRERVDRAYGRLQPSDPASFVAALRHPSATVRASAARALYQLGAALYIADLLPLLDDPDADVRSMAETAIFKAGDDALPTLQRLRRTPGRHRPFALTALAEVGGRPALDPADQAAVRRLIRVKLPRERPQPMHLCDGWLAFPSAGSSEATQAAIANVRAMAARLSVNPEALHSETRVEGHGLLAVTECGRRYGLPPGALAV